MVNRRTRRRLPRRDRRETLSGAMQKMLRFLTAGHCPIARK